MTDRDEPTMLGAAFQSAPGVLIISASRLRRFRECKLRYHLEFLLGLRPDADLETDGDRASGYGLQTHHELFLRHEDPARHDDASVLDPGPFDDLVASAADRHRLLCPGQDGLTYLGGELELKWLYSLKLVLITGRVDALWQADDGSIEVHDYKTGPVNHDIEDDEGTLMYALLAAANFPGKPIRIVYEFLGGEHPESVSVEVNADLLRRAVSILIETAQAIRREQDFRPTAHVSHCRSCPYRMTCPDAIKN